MNAMEMALTSRNWCKLEDGEKQKELEREIER